MDDNKTRKNYVENSPVFFIIVIIVIIISGLLSICHECFLLITIEYRMIWKNEIIQTKISDIKMERGFFFIWCPR